MRKTALLSGVAGLFLMSAPAFAQDPAPQTPPATPPAAEAASPQSMTLQPGAIVRGSDGVELGKLEGAIQTESGQQLTVRGADGQLRGVPTPGLTQEGDVIVAAWTSQQFTASPAVTDAKPAPDASTPDAETTPAPDTTTQPAPAPAEPAPSMSDPSAEPEPTDPASPPPTEQPTTPGEEPSTAPDGTPPPGA